MPFAPVVMGLFGIPRISMAMPIKLISYLENRYEILCYKLVTVMIIHFTLSWPFFPVKYFVCVSVVFIHSFFFYFKHFSLCLHSISWEVKGFTMMPQKKIHRTHSLIKCLSFAHVSHPKKKIWNNKIQFHKWIELQKVKVFFTINWMN